MLLWLFSVSRRRRVAVLLPFVRRRLCCTCGGCGVGCFSVSRRRRVVVLLPFVRRRFRCLCWRCSVVVAVVVVAVARLQRSAPMFVLLSRTKDVTI